MAWLSVPGVSETHGTVRPKQDHDALEVWLSLRVQPCVQAGRHRALAAAPLTDRHSCSFWHFVGALLLQPRSPRHAVLRNSPAHSLAHAKIDEKGLYRSHMSTGSHKGNSCANLLSFPAGVRASECVRRAVYAPGPGLQLGSGTSELGMTTAAAHRVRCDVTINNSDDGAELAIPAHRFDKQKVNPWAVGGRSGGPTLPRRIPNCSTRTLAPRRAELSRDHTASTQPASLDAPADGVFRIAV